jgi:FMN phosphatase YigB (HAD superfamily)
LEAVIRSTILSYSPPEDASRVLRELIRLEIPMGVVSNSIFSSDLLKSDIERLSVPEAFQFVISSAEFGFRKPHPAIFEDGVRKLGSTSAATWYVGDLWENDVMGSGGAGLIPVWLNASASPPDVSVPHLRVKNWTELGELLGV